MSKPIFSIVLASDKKENYKHIYNSLDISSYCSNLEKKRVEEVNTKKKIIKQNEKKKRTKKINKLISKQKYALKKLKRRNAKNKVTLPHSRLSDIPFEIIAVGNTPPYELMPDNFRYIYSDALPFQCLNIGVSNAIADYVLLVMDNMKYSELFLDTLYMFVSRILPYMKEVLIMPMYSMNGILRDDLMHLDTNDFFSPIIGKSCVFDKNMWVKLGGVDSGGIANLQMKFYEYGYTPFIATISIVEENISE